MPNSQERPPRTTETSPAPGRSSVTEATFAVQVQDFGPTGHGATYSTTQSGHAISGCYNVAPF